MRKSIFMLFCAFSLFTMNAQHTIQSKIVSKSTGKPLEFAAVRLLKPDSTLITGVTTDSTGIFVLKNVNPGKYILNVSSIGYKTVNQNLQLFSKDLNLPNIQMDEDSKLLKEVKVLGTAIQIVTKGDTLEYNAQAFKTNENAVVEDLLKKMPGVQVDASGNITVNGQQVTKILVNGKKFFNDDVQMATKNIPSNLVDKVQVLDQKSDMAKLTGFEDENTERVINLTIRKDKKQGIFGNIQAAAGGDVDKNFRYDSNAFLNIMNGDTQSSITASGNNTNTSRSGRGRGGFGGTQSGITETQNFGYNLNTPTSPKLTLGGDVSFNHSDNYQSAETNRDNYLQGTTYNTNSTSQNDRNNYDTRLRLEAEWKPDSLNTVVFQPTMSYSRDFYNQNSNYLYKTENDSTSWGDNKNVGNGYDLGGGLNVIFSHKFSKPGRTLTTQFSSSFTQSVDNGIINSNKYTNDSTTLIDEKSTNNSNNLSLGLRTSYVEPLWKNQHFLETILNLNGNFRNSTRDLFDKDANGNYTNFNSEYSNKFDNNFYSESLQFNYRYIQKFYTLTLGVKAEPSQTYSKTIYGDDSGEPIERNVINFAPSARFQYNFNKRKFIRLDYNGRTNQPSISQMQPVKNNTDLMNETVGNSNLNPEFAHNLRMMVSLFNDKNLSSFNLGLMGNATKDALTSNSIYDETGKRYIQTVNANEIPYNANLFFMYNKPFLKKFNFSDNASAGINQQYGYTSQHVNSSSLDINNLPLGDLSNTKRYSASENISLSYTEDLFDISARGGLRFSNTLNNFTTQINKTYDWTGTVNLGFRPTKTITFTTDLNYTNQVGYTTDNQTQWLWNASLEATAFKGKGVFSLKAYDILHQRLSIIQTVGDNYVQYSRTNTLPTYFLLGFTYKINVFKGGSSQDKQNFDNMNNQRRRFGNMPPGGGDRGGRPPMPLGGGGEPPMF